MREKQRDATREKIVEAALIAMSETGFDGVTTRAIAQRADVSQGLLTYHFPSKDALWRAAADHLFALKAAAMGDAVTNISENNSLEARREILRRLVRFNAKHPEFFRFLILQNAEDERRQEWLVTTHLAPIYARFGQIVGHFPEADIPHAFYAFGGASCIFFSAAAKCQSLTGLDPTSDAAIERHANFIANLMVPE